MWAQVVGWESDNSFGDFLGSPFSGFDGPGLRPTFDWPGTDGQEYDSGAFASVTRHFDTEQAPGRQRPFELSTGNFAIAYDVFGSMTVTARPGVNNFPGRKLGRVKRAPFSERARLHSVQLPGGKSRTVIKENGYTHVSLGPDGNVMVRITEPRSGTGSIIDLGGSFGSSVTLVASANDTIHVLGLNPDGQPVAATLSRESPAGEGWTSLGGRFSGALTASTRDELVDVLAVDADGAVSHRFLPSQGSDSGWTSIGGRVATPVAAIGTPAGELAVFGIGPDGIVHKRLDAERRWLPDGGEWDVLCRMGDHAGAPASVSAQWLSDEDLMVSVSSGDDILRGALLWRGYPQPDPDLQWTPVQEPARA